MPTTYTTTLCYSPSSVLIGGQTVPCGPAATIVTLQSGRQLSVQWVANGIEVVDAGTKLLRSFEPALRTSPTNFHSCMQSLVRYTDAYALYTKST